MFVLGVVKHTVIVLISAFLFSQVGPISAAAKYKDAKSMISLAGDYPQSIYK